MLWVLIFSVGYNGSSGEGVTSFRTKSLEVCENIYYQIQKERKKSKPITGYCVNTSTGDVVVL